MGGCGSGRHSSGKRTTAGYRQLDIRELKRKGFIEPGRRLTLQWSRGGEITASINLRTELDRVILSDRYRGSNGEGTSEEYPVWLDWTRCNYGGRRAWFQCPGRGCYRRVAVLYGGDVFAYRHCYQLRYESQHETAHSRALGRAQAIRVKLGGTREENFLLSPKGCTGAPMSVSVKGPNARRMRLGHRGFLR
jgi:hypothetical protein